jgi:hypothetical protein
MPRDACSEPLLQQSALSAAFAEQSASVDLNSSVERLIAKHPILAANSEAVLDLIYHEVVLREERGEEVRLGDYQRRFASLSRELTDLFAVHAATGESSSLLLESLAETESRNPPQQSRHTQL